MDISRRRGTRRGRRRAGREPIAIVVVERQAKCRRRVVAMAAKCGRAEAYDSPNGADTSHVDSPPDVVLVGLNTEPELALADARRLREAAPASLLIAYGSTGAVGALAAAMAAGARRCVSFPFDVAALRVAIDDVVAEQRRLIEATQAPADSAGTRDGGAPAEARVTAVYSPKGGVGTTTLAVNLACALRRLGRRVCLVDGNLSFGNIGVLLNTPAERTLLELVDDNAESIDGASMTRVVLAHESGVRVLLAPPSPVDAERVSAANLQRIIAVLRGQYDHVVIDTWSSYDERTLAILDAADDVLVTTTPETQSITNLIAFLRVTAMLNYEEDKLIPVLVRADSVEGSYLREVEQYLKRTLDHRIVSDGRRVTRSIMSGTPFVLADPDAVVSRNVFDLAEMLIQRDSAAKRPGSDAGGARSTSGAQRRNGRRVESRLWLAGVPALAAAALFGWTHLSAPTSRPRVSGAGHASMTATAVARMNQSATAVAGAYQSATAAAGTAATAWAAGAEATGTAEAQMLSAYALATLCAGTPSGGPQATPSATASPTATAFTASQCHQ